MDNLMDDPEFERALDKVAWTVWHRNRGRQRAANLLRYCRERNLSLDDVVVEEHTDYYWANRRNRTPREKQAKVIGYTNSTSGGYPVAIYWVMHKEQDS